MELSINKAVVEIIESGKPIVETPVDAAAEGQEFSGKATVFRITTSDTLDASFSLIEWNSSFMPDIRIQSFDNGLEKHERLKTAGKMSLMTTKDGNWLVELTALKYGGDKERATLKLPTFEELDHLAGQDFRELMFSLGAIRIGTKEEVNQETNRRKNYPAMVVPKGEKEAILAAFTVTRVLALVKDFGLPE